MKRTKADEVFTVAGKLDPSRLCQPLDRDFTFDALDLFEGNSGHVDVPPIFLLVL